MHLCIMQEKSEVMKPIVLFRGLTMTWHTRVAIGKCDTKRISQERYYNSNTALTNLIRVTFFYFHERHSNTSKQQLSSISRGQINMGM